MKLKKFKALKESDSNWESMHSSSFYDELLKHPAPNWDKNGIILLTLFFLCLVGYLFIGKVDVIIPAHGILRPKGSYFVVEALETGSVTNIFAKPGDFLKQGESLIELEFSEQQIELTKDSNNLQYEEKRLQRLIQSKREADIILKKLEYNLENNPGSELSGLLLNKFVSLKKAYIDFKNGIGAKFLYDQSLLEFNEEYANLKDEIQKEQNIISSLRGDTRIKKERVENAIIRMPFSGYVGSLMVNNIGQNIIRGQTVAELVEETQPLEAFVEIKNKDIGSIAVGMEAILKIRAFHQNDFGVIEAIVERIVPNVKEKDTFSVVLSIKTQSLLKDGKKFDLLPGLKVEADIITSRNRLFQVLFKKNQDLN
ncbi:MAG: HlyD family efflux transporter periplasmic adaptor subunit [Leptospira sp.]|jgi:multidrug resistance efflux pump|nr:HlyD family efflux transporter periplasmic adaptor subunit [Leptospira sp.]